MVCLLDQGTLSALARRLAVEMGGSDIERPRELQQASSRSGEEAGSRQLAELARQFAILDAARYNENECSATCAREWRTMVEQA